MYVVIQREWKVQWGKQDRISSGIVQFGLSMRLLDTLQIHIRYIVIISGKL